MSLYNLLFGVNQASELLLAMLGITRAGVPRFRDCYLDGEHIVIYTRTGGGNRDEYEDQNQELHLLPGFISDEDDDFDCTYAHFKYRAPEKFKAEIELLRDMGGGRDPRQAWQQLFEKLNDPARKDDPEVLAAIEKTRPIMEKIAESFKAQP